MADVFISYCSDERPLTADLASHLLGFGYSVWWDTSLLPHHIFREEIDRQLNAASSVVIIWTPRSISSQWVRSEADHARRQNKLINAYAGGVAFETLPKPFDQYYAVPVTSYLAIFKAIEQLRAGAPPSPAHPVPPSHFVTQAIAEALRRAEDLARLCVVENWQQDAAYIPRMIAAAKLLEEPLRLFRSRLPYGELTSYGNRVVVDRVDTTVAPVLSEVQKELNWMTNYGHREAVINGARNDLGFVATRLLEEIGTAPIIQPEPVA
jgi:hypothetical protein